MTAPNDAPDPRAPRRNRLMLLVLLGIFLLPILLAAIINYSGQRPAPTRQHGELLQPPVALEAHALRLADGSAYPWAPGERLWRIALAPPTDCGAECTRLARDLDKVWQLFGKEADRVHVLWLCATPGCTPPPGVLSPAPLRVLAPDPDLRAALPHVDDPRGVPVYVIDPNGFVVLRYAPGADPGGLRADVAKLLKLM